MADLPFFQENTLDVFKDRLDLLYSQNKELRDQSQLHMTLMSGSIALAATLKLIKGYPPEEQWKNVLQVGTLIVYALAMFVSILNVSSRRWIYPIEIADLRNRRPFTDQEYYTLLSESYFGAIYANYAIIIVKGWRLYWTTWAVILIVIAVILLIVTMPTT